MPKENSRARIQIEGLGISLIRLSLLTLLVGCGNDDLCLSPEDLSDPYHAQMVDQFAQGERIMSAFLGVSFFNYKSDPSLQAGHDKAIMETSAIVATLQAMVPPADLTSLHQDFIEIWQKRKSAFLFGHDALEDEIRRKELMTEVTEILRDAERRERKWRKKYRRLTCSALPERDPSSRFRW